MKKIQTRDRVYCPVMNKYHMNRIKERVRENEKSDKILCSFLVVSLILWSVL